jgi:hypothetical protein
MERNQGTIMPLTCFQDYPDRTAVLLLRLEILSLSGEYSIDNYVAGETSSELLLQVLTSFSCLKITSDGRAQ